MLSDVLRKDAYLKKYLANLLLSINAQTVFGYSA